jgi:hypothetical protein
MSTIWKTLKTGAGTILRLFVTDHGLVLSVLTWVALAAALVRIVPPPRRWVGAAFATGLMVMLVHSVWRAARSHARPLLDHPVQS